MDCGMLEVLLGTTLLRSESATRGASEPCNLCTSALPAEGPTEAGTLLALILPSAEEEEDPWGDWSEIVPAEREAETPKVETLLAEDGPAASRVDRPGRELDLKDIEPRT